MYLTICAGEMNGAKVVMTTVIMKWSQSQKRGIGEEDQILE